MASQPVRSGRWSPEQEAMYTELSNPAKSNLDPRSDPVQTPPKNPIKSTPLYGTRNRASRRDAK